MPNYVEKIFSNQQFGTRVYMKLAITIKLEQYTSPHPKI
jgi:hypothetical protein